MDLFLPESGLIIWMLIAFLIVFVILAKVGWPMIMNAVDKRNQHIIDSLKAAQEANEALAGVEENRKEEKKVKPLEKLAEKAVWLIRFRKRFRN